MLYHVSVPRDQGEIIWILETLFHKLRRSHEDKKNISVRDILNGVKDFNKGNLILLKVLAAALAGFLHTVVI